MKIIFESNGKKEGLYQNINYLEDKYGMEYLGLMDKSLMLSLLPVLGLNFNLGYKKVIMKLGNRLPKRICTDCGFVAEDDDLFKSEFSRREIHKQCRCCRKNVVIERELILFNGKDIEELPNARKEFKKY